MRNRIFFQRKEKIKALMKRQLKQTVYENYKAFNIIWINQRFSPVF